VKVAVSSTTKVPAAEPFELDTKVMPGASKDKGVPSPLTNESAVIPTDVSAKSPVFVAVIVKVITSPTSAPFESGSLTEKVLTVSISGISHSRTTKPSPPEIAEELAEPNPRPET